MARRRRASKIEILFETHSTTDGQRALGGVRLARRAASPLGRRQAKELGERREDDEFVAVFCSDLGRAVRDGADRVRRPRGPDLPRLAAARMQLRDARTERPSRGSRSSARVHVVDPYSGARATRDVVARARSFLHDLPAKHADKRIVVIGHSATKWAFDHILEGIPLDELVEGSFRWQPGWLYTPRGRRLTAPKRRTRRPRRSPRRVTLGPIVRAIWLDGSHGFHRVRRARRARAVAADEVGASARARRGRRRRCTASDRHWPVASRGSGSRTVGTCFWQRPRRVRRARAARGGSAISSATRRRCIEGVVRSVTSRRARAAEDPHRAGRRRDGRDQGDVVQPAVARGEARRGHRRPDPRPCEQVRLRRLVVRPGRRVRDARLRTGLPGDRGPRPEEASRPAPAGARVCSRRRRRSVRRSCSPPERLPLRCGRARMRSIALARRPRPRSDASVSPSTSCSSSGWRSLERRPRASAPRQSRWARRVSSWRATRRRSRSRSRRTRCARSAEIDADLDRSVPDAATAPGRGRLREDGRRASRAPSRGRGRRQGALMAPTETLAEQHFLTLDELCTPRSACASRCSRARSGASEHARRPPAHRVGRCADRRRDARAHREGGRLLRPRGRRRRRAAPLRRRAAHGARRGAKPARPAPHCDARSRERSR